MGNAENNILRTYLAPDHLDVVFSVGQLQQAPKTLLGNVLVDVPVLVEDLDDDPDASFSTLVFFD